MVTPVKAGVAAGVDAGDTGQSLAQGGLAEGGQLLALTLSMLWGTSLAGVGAGRGGDLFMLAAFADHGQGLALLPKSGRLMEPGIGRSITTISLQVCNEHVLHPITNWPTYNKSLIAVVLTTFWVDAEAMNNWFHHGHHGRRGRSQLYTDQTMHLPDAQGDFQPPFGHHPGLLDSLFELMNIRFVPPDYSCVSKRARTVAVAYRQPSKGKSLTWLSIDGPEGIW